MYVFIIVNYFFLKFLLETIFFNIIQLLMVDLLARASMKNTVNCDT